MIRLGTEVKAISEMEANVGRVVEIYMGPKPGMKGLVKVLWGPGEWTWENRSDLVEAIAPPEVLP